MKNTHAGIAPTALIIIVAIALLTAGTYTYTKIRNKDKAADDLISSARRSLERSSRSVSEIVAELASTQTRLRVEINKLDIFRRASYDPSSLFGQTIAAIQAEISDGVIGKTERLFTLVTDAGIDPSVKITLTQDRQQLIALVEEWQKKASAPKGTQTQADISAATQAVLDAAQDYVDSLNQAADQLTPENSGATPGEITQGQNNVDTAADTVNDAADTVSEVEPDPEVVNDIQNDVDDLQEELANATSTPPTGGGDSSNPDTSTTTTNGSGNPYIPPPYVPPTPPDTSGKPQLIQGANPF